MNFDAPETLFDGLTGTTGPVGIQRRPSVGFFFKLGYVAPAGTARMHRGPWVVTRRIGSTRGRDA